MFNQSKVPPRPIPADVPPPGGGTKKETDQDGITLESCRKRFEGKFPFGCLPVHEQLK